MKDNKFDLVTDEVKRRIGLAIKEAHGRFKDTNPYRMEKVTDEDRLQDFQSLTPEKVAFARQNFGDESVEAYFNQMQGLLEKRNERKAV